MTNHERTGQAREEGPGERFLLVEFQAIISLRESLHQLVHFRFNLFLALLAGGIAFLVFIGENFTPTDFLVALLAVLIPLQGIGLMAFSRSLEGQILGVLYLRGLNKIRAYYARHWPEIKEALSMPIDHSKPSFDMPGSMAGRNRWWFEFSSLSSMTAVTNCAISAAVIWAICQLYLPMFGVSWNGAPVLVGLVVSLVVLSLQFVYARKRTREAEAEYKSNTPEELNSSV